MGRQGTNWDALKRNSHKVTLRDPRRLGEMGRCREIRAGDALRRTGSALERTGSNMEREEKTPEREK
jgi:hypothetical protein